jgi:hypothetical protein
MFAKQEGVPVDPIALEARIRSAVAEVVAKQAAAGVDVVSDGEMSKPSYVLHLRPPRRFRRHQPAAHLRRPRRLPDAAEEGLRRPRPQPPPHARLRRGDRGPRPRGGEGRRRAPAGRAARRPPGLPQRRLARRHRGCTGCQARPPNYEGPHHCDVPFKDIVDLVFKARPNAIAFEAANPRHAHEWQMFEDVKLPDGKVLIPGVLESKANFIERPELIAQRIRRYADLVGAENVLAGTDCGYGIPRPPTRPGRGRSRRRAGEARRAPRARRSPHASSSETVFAPSTSDWSLPNADSRVRYFIPQSGAATRSVV